MDVESVVLTALQVLSPVLLAALSWRLRLGVEGGVWGVYLFGENLTDDDGAVSPYQLGPAGPATRMRPRTIGLQLRASF